MTTTRRDIGAIFALIAFTLAPLAHAAAPTPATTGAACAKRTEIKSDGTIVVHTRCVLVTR